MSELKQVFIIITPDTSGFLPPAAAVLAKLDLARQDELALARMDDDGWGCAIT